MDNHLPNDFDLIVVGTGMVESILSAAASRIGKRVLHIDRNNYYGGQWASFNLDAIHNINITGNNEVITTCSDVPNPGEDISNIGNNLFSIEDFKIVWHITEKKTDDISKNISNKIEEIAEQNAKVQDNSCSEELWTRENLLKLSRKFNIDITPKLQFARGDLVELLISSNIARYSEYRSVSRVLTWLNGQLEVVPCSRSDVFANSKVSVIEKRMLMKLLTSLDNEKEQLKNYENKTFHAFLKDQKLTPNIIHYVLYALSNSTDETPCFQGVENIKRFLNSLGRFGKTPFLLSMYGSGEIPQAFCRLSAVFGGVYALGQPLNGLVFADDKFKSLLVENQRINADHIVMSIERSPEKFVQSVTKKLISRAVFITDRTIMPSEKEHLTLLLYPPENNKRSVTIIEMGSLTGTCPKDLYLVHLISSQITTPEEDFKHVTNNLFTTNTENKEISSKPQILWSCYFSLPDASGADLRRNVPKNVFLCPGPDMDLDYDFSIRKAKEIFGEMYPDTEFLPRAPDPEEIVIEGDNESKDEMLVPINEEGTEAENKIVNELAQNLERNKLDNNQSEEKD